MNFYIGTLLCVTLKGRVADQATICYNDVPHYTVHHTR